MERCGEIRKDGSPCTARALPNSRFCWAHDPGLAEQRREKRAQGGANRATLRRAGRRLPADLRAVLDRLHGAMAEVEAGGMEPRVGTALATLAGAILKVHEVAELETRLAALEAQHEQHRTG